MKVEIYSDVVCPWCYIGERRFARALEAFPDADEVEVVFRPYQLDPEAPEQAMPLTAYLEGRYGPGAAAMRARVGEAAAGEGIAIAWDAALAANTMTAHRLLSLAEREYGADFQRALLEKLFDLHFARGGDISNRETLTDLAGAVGIDPERVRAYLGSEDGSRGVEAEIAAARRLGIRAVPTFVFDGRYVVQGAQPVPVFLGVLEQAAAASADASGEHHDDGAPDV